MKKSRKIYIIIISIFIVLSIAAYLFINSLASSGLIDYDENIQLKELKNEVTVLRDNYGVPHIYAENEEDLYRAVGYIQARDRFWQMDLLRRVTQGRLSEIFGKKMIDADILFRSLRIPMKSETLWKNFDPKLKKTLTAYTQGVNQYLAENDLSFEFKVLGYKPDKWKEQHSINLIGYMAWDLSTAWSTELLFYKLQQKLPKEKFIELLQNMDLQTAICPDFSLGRIPDDSTLLVASYKVADIIPSVFNASNNWAVSGKKSTTGKPIFANDMHLGLMIPGVWTQMHQVIDGELDVTGVVLPGQPCIIAGHNANIAWGMTNVQNDDIDFYIETINPENENQYKFNGEWKDFEIKNETILTKEGDTVIAEIKFTHRGPVVSGMKNIDDQVISARWLGNEYSNELRSLYLLNRAKDWDDFKNALTTFISVSQNVNYADIQGNIGIHCSAGVPKRKLPGWQVFPGDTDLYDWKEFVPFDSLPHQYNPEKGYVFSANNRTAGDNYPYYISAWYSLPDRAERIEEMLKEKDKLSIDDFKMMHTDQKAIFARKILTSAFSVTKANDFNEKSKIAFKLLSEWDYNMDADKPESLIYETFYLYLANNIVSDEMGEEFYTEFQRNGKATSYIINNIAQKGSSIWCDDITTDKKENFADMIIISLNQTVDSLTAKYGNDLTAMKWGNAHKMVLEHPLGKVKILDIVFNLNRKFSVGGSFHTVSPYSYNIGKGFDARHGASHRHIFSLGNFNNSQVIIPTGVSGIPTSEHYCDQSNDYIKGIYHPDYFSKDKIEEHAKYKMTFKP